MIDRHQPTSLFTRSGVIVAVTNYEPERLKRFPFRAQRPETETGDRGIEGSGGRKHNKQSQVQGGRDARTWNIWQRKVAHDHSSSSYPALGLAEGGRGETEAQAQMKRWVGTPCHEECWRLTCSASWYLVTLGYLVHIICIEHSRRQGIVGDRASKGCHGGAETCRAHQPAYSTHRHSPRSLRLI